MKGEDADTEAITIRPITMADLSAVVRIEEDSYTVPWSRATFRNLIDRQDTDLIVAEVDGDVIGYAITWFVVDQGELGNIAVDGEWRRRGVARRLLERALERSARRRVRELYLEVRRSNTGAQKLYREFGFRQVGVRRSYYVKPVEDALVMRRVIDEVGHV